MLMFDPDDKSQVAALLKDHVDVVLANSTLTSLYCNSLDHKDAISILEQVLSTRRLSLTKEELNGIHWELAIHYENIGEVDKAISMYKLATNFNDKDALMIYLFRVRQLKGNPTAYQEALRLLAENGETLATLCGIAQECFFNELYTDELRYLKKAITLAPNDADICSDLAFTYKMLDQEKEAAYWEKKVTLLAGV
jgi:tetratricopeptide (TPR) repeat protein